MKDNEVKNIIDATQENTLINNQDLQHIVGGNPFPNSASKSETDPTPNNIAAERAVKEIGKPYRWGAVGPESYDASGFVSYCLSGVHARLGTTTTFLGWPRVSHPEPGDVCVSSSHCGIYIGGHQMIHAPQPGQCISYGAVQSGMIIVRMP